MTETKPETQFAMNRVNLLVLGLKIPFEIETHYDLTPQEAWDDQCVLWSVDDDGATYKCSILLTDKAFVKREKMKILVRFDDVVADSVYSCVIDQGEKSIVLFQNFVITEDMSSE